MIIILLIIVCVHFNKYSANRDAYLCIERRNHQYFLKHSIDKEVESMNRRKRECEIYLNELGEDLSEFLNMHCKRSGVFDVNRTTTVLHEFFTRYGLQIGTETLLDEHISHKEYEIDYYISQYIFECNNSGSEKYEVLLDLIKGYFLRLAIYMQPDNSSLKTASYSKITFIYDTPFLIDLLGYNGKESEEKAVAMHEMLSRQKAKFGYFSHILNEVIDILTAYKYSLNPYYNSVGTRTLAGLNDKNYKTNDVDREIAWLPDRLKNNFSVCEIEIPRYEIGDNGINTQKIVSEIEMKQYIRENTPHYKDGNLDNDVCSVLAIHRMREGELCNTIEVCPSILVTTNYSFIKALNDFYKRNINGRTFPLAISDSNLAALTWIKCGDMGNLPERELLKNAYSAMQPIPEIMKQVEITLGKMKESGKITAEQVVVLRSSRVFQNNIWTNSFGDIDRVNEMSVKEAEEMYKKHLVKDVSVDFEKKIKTLNEQATQKETDQLRNCKIQADEYAKNKRDEWLKNRKRIWRIAMVGVLSFGVVGLLYSTIISQSISLIIATGIFVLLSIISMFDTLSSKRKHLYNWLEKRANQYETKIREMKMEEYRKITKID